MDFPPSPATDVHRPPLTAAAVPPAAALTVLAARLVDAPAALVVGTGAGAPGDDPRSRALAAWLAADPVRTDAPLVLHDARAHPALAATGVGALVGVPVRGPSGARVATLVALDDAPRAWPADAPAVLGDVAAAVAEEIALREALARSGRARAGGDGSSAVEEALRASEARLQQAQKREAMGRLAGGVAHDFNNLLTVIIGCLELADADIPDGSAARARLAEVRRAADRAARLTQQLLAFSRQQVLAPRVLDLNALVAGAATMIGRLVGDDVALSTVLRPLPGPVRADPGQLEQVLMNLAVNARDAMPGGGALAIETGAVPDAAELRHAAGGVPIEPGPYVRVTVRDAGCGMDEATRARLFEPFFTTKEVGRGTGLGMAIVYGIVKQSGGYVFVDSAPGAGTTVRVYLPVVEAGAAPAETAPTARARLRGTETVLVAEDDPVLCGLARDVLAASGYTVLTAGDGLDAVDAAAGHRGALHLVLADVLMPRLGGREAGRRITAARPATPVVYMSGHIGEAAIHQDRLTLGENEGFLMKPFTPDALLAKVREVLDRRTR